MPGRKLQTLRAEWNSEDNKDVVILHQFPRHPKCPSPSMYVMKLETFLRMHDIKYKSDFDHPRSPETGKSPWITFNGEDVSDSQIIIEYLTEKLSLTLKNDLKNAQDRVLCRGLRAIVEDNLAFCRTSELFIHGNPDDIKDLLPTFTPVKAINKLVNKRICSMVGNQAKAQGMGRHKEETMLKIAEDDLETLSLALGDKQFFLGSDPAEIDATVFGLTSVIYNFGPANQQITKLAEKFDNLKAHCDRMKERFWSDFDEICQKAAEEKAPPKKEKKEEENKEEEGAAADDGEEVKKDEEKKEDETKKE